MVRLNAAKDENDRHLQEDDETGSGVTTSIRQAANQARQPTYNSNIHDAYLCRPSRMYNQRRRASRRSAPSAAMTLNLC